MHRRTAAGPADLAGPTRPGLAWLLHCGASFRLLPALPPALGWSVRS